MASADDAPQGMSLDRSGEALADESSPPVSDAPLPADPPPPDSAEFAVRRPDMPRRPGVFPIDFPPEHTLKTQPIPGQPLEGDSDSIEFLLRNAFRASERFKSMGPGIFPTLAPGATPEAKAIAPSKSTVVKSSRPAHVVESLAPLMGFAVVSRAPPKFRPKAIQYPSGNALGTQLHQPFGDRLKAMMTALMTPKKPE